MALHTSDIAYLESTVRQIASTVGIRRAKWERFEQKLYELKEHNLEMYAHSLRVGIYTHGIAAVENQRDLKFPLFAGCGHDIGKCDIPNEILNAVNFGEAEYEKIKAHTVNGYKRLKKDFLFTSLIAGLHHKYQETSYGIDLKKDLPFWLSKGAKAKIENMAQLVMVADFFDALTTRKNNKGLVSSVEDTDELREVLLKHFPAYQYRVGWLLNHQIR